MIGQRSRGRGAAVAVAGFSVVAMVMFSAAPAFAWVQKSGAKTCTSSAPFSFTRSLASGLVYQNGPGGSTQTFSNGSTLKVSVTQGANYGGSWLVKSDGSLNDPGTYAYCSSAQ